MTVIYHSYEWYIPGLLWFYKRLFLQKTLNFSYTRRGYPNWNLKIKMYRIRLLRRLICCNKVLFMRIFRILPGHNYHILVFLGLQLKQFGSWNVIGMIFVRDQFLTTAPIFLLGAKPWLRRRRPHRCFGRTFWMKQSKGCAQWPSWRGGRHFHQAECLPLLSQCK